MGKAQLKVKLLTMTPDPDKLTALAARMCYSGMDMDQLLERVDTQDQAAFLEGVMGRGHLSVAEHASFSFLVEGVSRALLAQLTRHRIASFSVQSQRYVSMEKTFDYVIPPAITALGPEAEKRYISQMDQMHNWYCEWQTALGGQGQSSNEDARFVLPNAAATRLVVTMNARELAHFFSLRCCGRAQWEIREMAWQMLICCRQAAPVLFAKAGPACLSGPCPEGKNSCGQMAAMRARAASIGKMDGTDA
ncbi:MAG: FAD-dependent thymidylate synthase [Clostridia bacterium]|nr:FAD-dependent thymidylate synthase [Clostridia bacterium]